MGYALGFQASVKIVHQVSAMQRLRPHGFVSVNKYYGCISVCKAVVKGKHSAVFAMWFHKADKMIVRVIDEI